MPDNIALKPRVLGVIPARLGSQRLPRKMLRQIAGRSLLAWTFQAARACPQLDQLVIAVDSEEITALCRDQGWPFLVTSPTLPSGTDRLHAVSQHFDADIYVNVQGDEPLIRATHLEALLDPFYDPVVEVSTLKIACMPEEITNPNAVKVVTAQDGRALYFSRAAIPFDREGSGNAPYFKHLGLYAYRREALRRFASLPQTRLEQVEKLEQLRLLESGMSLHVREVKEPTVGVDTEEDLNVVERLLLARLAQDG